MFEIKDHYSHVYVKQAILLVSCDIISEGMRKREEGEKR